MVLSATFSNPHQPGAILRLYPFNPPSTPVSPLKQYDQPKDQSPYYDALEKQESDPTSRLCPYEIFSHPVTEPWPSACESSDPSPASQASGPLTNIKLINSLKCGSITQVWVATVHSCLTPSPSEFVVAKIFDPRACDSDEYSEHDPILFCQHLLTNETWAYKQFAGLEPHIPCYLGTYASTMDDGRMIGVLLLEYLFAPSLLHVANVSNPSEVFYQILRLEREMYERRVLHEETAMQNYFFCSGVGIVALHFDSAEEWTDEAWERMAESGSFGKWQFDRWSDELKGDDWTDCKWIPREPGEEYEEPGEEHEVSKEWLWKVIESVNEM